MAEHRKVDVVTIGAGWTAGIMAQQLTEEGLEVVSLERGPERWTTPDFTHNRDHLRYAVRYQMMVDLARETWTWRPNTDVPALPMRQYGSFHPGAGTGGAGVHWAGQSWRFLPFDFRYRTHHLERYGEEKLPEGNTIQDWPISYEELAPYYEQWEYDIGVSGRAGNLGGQVIEGGNPFEGPRERQYPLPPLPTTIPAEMFSDACQELGYHPFPQPSGILSEAYTDLSGVTRSGCMLCGYCTRFGCHVDAKSSALTTHLPMALDSGRYEIRYGATVVRIDTNADGLATGVTYIDAAGRMHHQPAEMVLVTAFTLSNVRLLLLSQSDAHPGGVGNDRDRVGRNYTYQISKAPASGLFEGRRFNMFMGNGCTLNVIYDLYGDNFDHSDLDFIGGGRIMCGGGERSPLAALDGVPFGGENDAPTWGREWKERFTQHWDSFAGISYEGDSLPYEDHVLDLDPNYRDAYGLPLLRITFDFKDNEKALHQYIAARIIEIMEAMGPDVMDSQPELDPYNIYTYQSTHNNGGTIMGESPEDSVVNKYCQVWDTPNVFVIGASNFPQNPGANPTETVCALAYHSAAGIREQYLGAPERLMG